MLRCALYMPHQFQACNIFAHWLILNSSDIATKCRRSTYKFELYAKFYSTAFWIINAFPPRHLSINDRVLTRIETPSRNIGKRRRHSDYASSRLVPLSRMLGSAPNDYWSRFRLNWQRFRQRMYECWRSTSHNDEACSNAYAKSPKGKYCSFCECKLVAELCSFKY